ncbi:hypothetical protein [Frankia gtarii]|uniref:hypothetical protein n=1 Tax=Frankia gtarii TaxID=2950102 RepID=UPI0021C1F4F6|nr:hypothetical protein [Frankia gtarii]
MPAQSRTHGDARARGSLRGPAATRTPLDDFNDRIDRAAIDPDDPDGPPRLLTAVEVANLFEVRQRTATFWATSGDLEGIKGSRAYGWRFSVANIKTFAAKYFTVS